MRRTVLIGAAGALALTAAACGSKEEAPQNEMATASDTNTMTADPSNPFAEAEAQMHQRMMAAVGADPSETWIRKMIEHHRGAVAMADIVLAQNPTPEVEAEAEKTRTDQLREIGKLEAMLRSVQAASPATEPTSAQTSSAPAAESPPPAAERTATSPAPKPAPKPAPEPAPDPHAGHDMNNMQ